MGVEVLDISRTEFKRLMNRKTIVSHMRVKGDSDYVLMRCKVTFGMSCRNYWNPISDATDWELVAFREFNTLDDVQGFVDAHNYHQEHSAVRNSFQPCSTSCAVGFEIWHLVDVEKTKDDAKDADYRRFYDFHLQNLPVRFIADGPVRADFKTSQRVMFSLAFHDNQNENIDCLYDSLDYLNLNFGISSICSEVRWSKRLRMNVCNIYLEHDGPASPVWWYQHTSCLRSIQRLPWGFAHLRSVMQFIHYIADRHLMRPMFAFGIYDDDKFMDECDVLFNDVLAKIPF